MRSGGHREACTAGHGDRTRNRSKAGMSLQISEMAAADIGAIPDCLPRAVCIVRVADWFV